MAEYIEREASCKDCSHYPVCEDKLFGSNHKNCRHFINKADVVEVVHCKDCNKWERNSGFVDSPNGHCFYHGIDTNGYDFCSYAERKPQKDNALRDLSGNVIRGECDKTPPEYKASHDINCGAKMDGVPDTNVGKMDGKGEGGG